MLIAPPPLPKARRDFHLSPEHPLNVGYRQGAKSDPQTYFDIHDGFEFGIVIEGCLRMQWGHVQRDFGPGEIWLCDYFEPHGFRFLRGPWKLVYAHLWDGLLANAPSLVAQPLDWFAPFRVPPASRASVPDSARAELRAVGMYMRRLLEQGDPPGYASLTLLVLEVLTRFATTTTTTAAETNDKYGDSVQRAVSKLLQSRTLITAEDMAAELGMAAGVFRRRFARETGNSFSRFGLRCRLNGAAQDLSLTEHPIKAIAIDWGFADESHFHRVFLRHFGCTPGTYRRRHKGSRHADGA